MSGSLLVDKHRPRSLADLNYHDELSQRLKSLAATDFPHTLFYGPSGAGKKTRIMCVLRELYGPGVEKLRIDQRTFLTPSRKKLEVNIVQSNYHIELTPSDVGIYDRSVIQEILKEIAQTQQVDLNAKKRFKVVIINEADLLSRDAQSALRRTMEKYTASLRVILCANSTSKIIGPIRSRCLLLRVGAPSEEEISKVLASVSKKESLSLPSHVALLLARLSSGNLRRALLSLEALHVRDPTFKSISASHSLLADAQAAERKDELDAVPRPDWEMFLATVGSQIMQEQSPERLLAVRGMLYELLVHCIPAPMILTTLAKRLVLHADEKIKSEIIHTAAFYEHRLRLGSKPIFHLEGFVAKVMSIIKQQKAGIDME